MTDLFWPTYETIEKLWKQDQLTSMSYHFATRLLRVLIDQSAMKLNLSAAGTGRTILAACGTSQSEELGAQMAIDLLEDSGYSVRFMGGGVSPDEIMAQVQEVRPDVLLMFCSAASDLPGIRFIIDNMREIGGNDKTQIVVGGGVFNRADGLAEEIGADLWAADPLELVDSLTNEAARRATANQRTVGKTRVSAPAAKPTQQQASQQIKTKTRAAA
jgi:methanogenic corrinoid protein MtbC1